MADDILNRLSAFPNLPKQDPGIMENIEEALEPCVGGWSQFEDNCYRVEPEALSWDDAEKRCDKLEAELVKINSKEENEFVLQLARRFAGERKQIWIGLKWESRAFYWSDNSIPVYTNWAEDEPNGNAKEPCGSMYIAQTVLPNKASGYWNDLTCGARTDQYASGLVCKKLALF
ncbi:hypothetical protein OS493_013441 [Desmophyllum pertusum]|uniref:C-type lectin domain-containing protein n=1 Tax=Desmophyllum pertusum TaxID=174260 RepID=A0A9W9YDL3_9CNID|nr:hypothetical protein OS493_013441 [Desmophyllum pertusum]